MTGGPEHPREAIVLAGGRGTRMRGVLGEKPKAMAPVEGRPLLAFLLDYLALGGVERVILSVGFRAEAIVDHFGEAYDSLELVYSRETEPLGTGGAVRRAFGEVRGEHAFLLNGDTLFLVELARLFQLHRRSGAPITLSLKPMRDFDRYGTVELEGDRVVGFHEKRPTQEGLVNGGVYAVSRTLLDDFPSLESFSLERELLEPRAREIGARGLKSEGFFLDLGTPEDYRRAEGRLGEALRDFAG